MTGIDCQRRQDRKDLLHEVVFQILFFMTREGFIRNQRNAGCLSVAAGSLRVNNEPARRQAQECVLAFSATVPPGVSPSGETMFACSSSSLRPDTRIMEELVEVRREDGQKLQPLEQWIAVVERFFQHSRVEFQQAQLAIEEEL